MLARRKVSSICLVILLSGVILIVMCSFFEFDSRVESCLIGILTGITSGALLALITTYCQQRIDVSRQKAMLFSWCKYLMGVLKQFSINYAIAEKYEVDPNSLEVLLRSVEGSGMQCANSICMAIDENLFLKKDKRIKIGFLRSLWGEMGFEINQLHSQCETIKTEGEILRIRYQQKHLASPMNADYRLYSEEIKRLECKIKLSSQSVCDKAKKTASKYSDEILSAISVLYDESEKARISKILREHERDFTNSAEEMLRPRGGVPLEWGLTAIF